MQSRSVPGRAGGRPIRSSFLSTFEGMQRAHTIVVALATLAFAALPGAAAAAPSDHRAGGEADHGRYLVVLANPKDSPREVAEEHRRRYGAEISSVFEHAVRGYAARLPEQAIAGISHDPRVAYVEPDHVVQTTAQGVPTGIRRISAPENPSIDIDGTDDIRVDADVAILDTGLDADHPDLNVGSSTDCTAGGAMGLCTAGGADDSGHGTHVAGTAAALDNDLGVVGVAPGARLHGVKVLAASGDGLVSWVIAGIDWVTARADTIEVANMSLACGCHNKALDAAIAASIDAGIVYVVAAGNNDRDAGGFSPANHPDVITVSAVADFDGAPGGAGQPTCRIDQDDTLADFSNWGNLIELAAPGACIVSTWMLGGYKVLNGTSMASPHVAGAAALLTSGANDPQGRSDVLAVRDTLVNAGSLDWFDDSGDGVREALLDVGNPEAFVANSPTRTLGNGTHEPPNQAPSAAFDYSCSDLTCTFDATASADADGAISGYAWDFGDATIGSGVTITKTYSETGIYTVILEVTDDRGSRATTSKSITTGSDGGSEPPPNSFILSASGFRLQGNATIDLTWRGTDRAGTVIVYRNGHVVATTDDDGSYTDVIRSSSGRLTYMLCEEGTTRCSNEASMF